MMDAKWRWLGMLGVIFVLTDGASSLKCFTCSSITDDKCGVSWGYDAGQADRYIDECVGHVVLCRKLEYQLFPHGEKIVTRSCWNSTTVWLPPDTKCTDMNRGRACYCDSGDYPCNGGQLQLSSIRLILGVVFLIFGFCQMTM